MKSILFFLLILFCAAAIGQTTGGVFNASKAQAFNKSATSNGGHPLDYKAMYHDTIHFVDRPYTSIAEANSFLPSVQRVIGLQVVINTGGSVSGSTGLLTGGTNSYYYYKDGIADGNLVQFDAIPNLSQVLASGASIGSSTKTIKGVGSNDLLFDSLHNYEVRYMNRTKLYADGGQATALFFPSVIQLNAGDSISVGGTFGVGTGQLSIFSPTIHYSTLKFVSHAGTPGTDSLYVKGSDGTVKTIAPNYYGTGSGVADSVKIQHGPGQNMVYGKGDTLVDKGIITTSTLLTVTTRSADSVVIVKPANDSIAPNTVLSYNSASRPGMYTIAQLLGYTPVPDSRTITINGSSHPLTANVVDSSSLPLTQGADKTVDGNGHALVFNNQSVVQAKTTVLIGDTITRVGTIFTDNFVRGSLGSNWGSALPNATLNFTSGRMAISGGVGDFTNYIQYSIPTGRKRGIAALACRITTVNSTSYGPSIGPKSTNSNLQTSIKAQFCMHTGGNLGTIVFWDGSGNQIGSTSAGQTISSGDSLFCMLEWVDNVYTATYMDVTAGTFVTNSFTYGTATGSTPVIPNTGKLTIFFNGGAQTNPTFLYSSKDVVGSVAFLGNSIMTGYDATIISKRYVSLIFGSRDDYALYGGPGDASADLIKTLPEVAAGAHRIIIFADGVNDGLNSVSTTTYSQNIDSAIRYLAAHSPTSRLVLMENCPQNSVAIKPYNDTLHALATRYGLTVIPIYDTLRSGTGWKTQYDGGDGIHPSDSAEKAIAYQITTTIPDILPTSNGGSLYYPSMPSTTNTSFDLVAIDHGHPYHIPFSLFGTTSTNLQGAFDASNALNRNNSFNMGSHLLSFKNSADSLKVAISSGTADLTINRFNFNGGMMSLVGNPFSLQFDAGGGAVAQFQETGGSLDYSSTAGQPFKIRGPLAFELQMTGATDRAWMRIKDQSGGDAGTVGAWPSGFATSALRYVVGMQGRNLSTAGMLGIDSNNNVFAGDFGTISITGGQRIHLLGTMHGYDTAALNKRFSYNSNIHSSFTTYSLVDYSFTDSLARKIAHDSSNIDEGVYTPTISNTTNVASSTTHDLNWHRVKNGYEVSGYISITPTASATNTTFDLSMPNGTWGVSDKGKIGGSGSGDGVNMSVTIKGNTGTGNAQFKFVSISTSPVDIYFTMGGHYEAP